MFRIRVEHLVNKPIEEVFDAISDHENYKFFPGIRKSTLIEEGHREKNGVGALREIVAGPFKLSERITGFTRPTLMTYHIEKTRPLAMRHDKGEMRLSSEGSMTRVIWISEGHIKAPMLGSLIIDKVVEKQITESFIDILQSID